MGRSLGDGGGGGAGDDLERGRLPAVCAKTGVPCDGLVKDTLAGRCRAGCRRCASCRRPYFVGRAYTARRLEVGSRSRRTASSGSGGWCGRVDRAGAGARRVLGRVLRRGDRRGARARARGSSPTSASSTSAIRCGSAAGRAAATDVVILTRIHPEFAPRCVRAVRAGRVGPCCRRLLIGGFVACPSLAEPAADAFRRVVERLGRG